MARWRKLLEQMRVSVRCVGFTYQDAVAILTALGFTEVRTNAGGSHRRWYRLRADGTRVIVGLVESGHADIKPVYIKTMLKTLKDEQLLPGDDA